jgi:hypothetical protein
MSSFYSYSCPFGQARTVEFAPSLPYFFCQGLAEKERLTALSNSGKAVRLFYMEVQYVRSKCGIKFCLANAFS